MGAAERIAELITAMQEHEIAEVLDFAEFLIAKRARDQTNTLARFDKFTGFDPGNSTALASECTTL